MLCLFVVVPCHAGGRLESVSFVELNIPLTVLTNSQVSPEISGYIERIIGQVYSTTNAHNFDIDIMITNSYLGTVTTLYSANDVATNFDYRPRFALHDTAGSVINTNNLERLPVVRGRVVFKIGDEATTNVGFKIQVIYESRR